MPFRVVKQLMPAPTSSVDRDGITFEDPSWFQRNTIWVSKLSGSNDQTFEYNNESDATTKMNELAGSDSSGRLYRVIEI
tara:strand:- start:442 stop:678 length:237 start_codon:yes stop_codon:yes gene_type:complete